MKKHQTILLKGFCLIAVFFIYFGISFAQAPTYTCVIKNDIQINATTFRFDIFLIKDVGSTQLRLSTHQYGIFFNQSIINGGTITASIIPGSSQLNSGNQPAGIFIQTNAASGNKYIQITSPTPSLATATDIPVSPGLRVCTVELSNSQPFGQFQPNLFWMWPTTTIPCVVSATVPSYYPSKVSYYNTSNASTALCVNSLTHLYNVSNPVLNTFPPLVFAVTGGGSYCQGSSGLPVGLTNSELGVTYTLYKNAVAQVPTVTGTGSAISFGNQLFGTYTVSGTNGSGTTQMTGSAVITETPSVPVNVAIAPDANNICAGTSVIFTATPTNGGTPTYQWYKNTLAVGTNSPSYSYTPLNGDQVYVVMTSTVNCGTPVPATSNIVTMSVIAGGPATVSIGVNANPSCGTTPVTFTATPGNGGSPSYQWFLNSSPVGTNLPTYSFVPVAGDQVYVVMTSSLACATGSPVTSNTITMAVSTPVAASVSMTPSANPVCAGTTVSYTATPVNGGTPTYQWYKNTLPVGTNLPTYSYVPANNDQVYVVMASGLSCTTGSPATSATTTMSVNALPVPTVSGPASICIGSTGNVYSTQVGMTSYTWSVSSGGTITAGGTLTDNTITVSWNTSGPQTVTVNYTNASSCTALTPVVYNVTVNPLPVPTITGPASACLNTIGNVYTSQAGMTGYNWTVSAGGTITAGGTSTSSSVTVTWNSAGPQTVSVNYTNANTCSAIAPTIYNVTVNPLPIPTITGPISACVNSSGNVYTTQAGMTGYTWTVSSGGSITAGAGTNAITVSWNTAGPQTVSVNYSNANLCSAPAPIIYNVTVNVLPVPTVAGPATVCAGSTGNVYTTQTGMTGYLWTVSPGGSITAGAGTNAITVTWTTAGAKTVTANYANANSCTAATATVYNVNVNALPVPTITGLTPAGVGTTQVYTTETGMTGYVWTVSAGGTITAGGTATSNTVTVLWNIAGAQTVSVNYTNANSCSAATATVYPVNVISIPPAAGTITGTSTVCQGATGVAYTVAAIPNATSYVWSLPVGATIATGANTNSITVNYSISAVSGIITVYGANTYGNGIPSPNYAVTVNTTPVPTISGSSSACTGVAGNVYSTQTGNSSYTWIVSAGGTITAGAGTNAITVTWNTAGAKTVSVNYSNASGCQGLAPAILNVNVGTSTAPTVQGTVEVCAGTAGVTYTTEPGFMNYTWTISYGGIITAGLNTNQVTVTWSTAGQRNISVNYSNTTGCNAPAPYIHSVTVLSAPVPVISGNNNVCQGTTGVVYTTQSNNSDYVWTVSPGGTITAGAGTNSITVTWNTGGNQTVSVSYSNDLGCAAIEPTVFSITVAPKPATAGTITGTTPVCAGTQGVVYSVPAIANANSYNWTVPAGATISAGATTNSITVNFALNASSGIIKVNGVNDCGAGASSPNYNVVVNPIPQTPVITQHGDTLTSNANTGNQWYLNGVAIAGATGKQHIAVYTGNYTVVVTLTGCSSATSNSILVLPVSINDLTIEKTFEVFPNPNKGNFDIKVQSSKKIDCTLEIYNSLGSLILKQENVLIDGTFTRHIDIEGYPTGTYMVVLRSIDNNVIRKVIITR